MTNYLNTTEATTSIQHGVIYRWSEGAWRSGNQAISRKVARQLTNQGIAYVNSKQDTLSATRLKQH